MIKPKFRPNTWDADIFRGIVDLNEYNIPSDLSDFRVYDIGGHIGSFSWLSAKNKAQEVIYCEVFSENFDIGNEWVCLSVLNKQFTDTKFYLDNHAVWKTDNNKYLSFNKSSNPINTGGGSVLTNEEDNVIHVSTIPFDLLQKIELSPDKKYKKTLLKLDCEGSEFPILLSSNLDKIDYICGEYHEIFQYIPDKAKVEGYDYYDVYLLQKVLKEKGFKYTYFDRSKDDKGNDVPLGHFWASKTKDNFFINITLSEVVLEKI